MRKYHVRWVFLTEEEMKFWRPQWQVAGNLPPWLRFVEKLGTAYVFELRE
jgi:hypothetical protein